MFPWERRWAVSGERRLRARGDPRGFLDSGLESYGYLVSAAWWGVIAAAITVLVELPSLFVSRGATTLTWAALGAVIALVAMTFVRLYQSKRTREPIDRAAFPAE